MTLIFDARQLRRDIFESQQAASAAPAESALEAHTREFTRLDNLATQMRLAGAPKAAVRWMTQQADIAYRAARSEGRSPMHPGDAT